MEIGSVMKGSSFAGNPKTKKEEIDGLGYIHRRISSRKKWIFYPVGFKIMVVSTDAATLN